MNTNIEIIDTHCHLYSENLKSDMPNIMERRQDKGVSKIFMPNVDKESIATMLDVEANYEHCYSMMGLHPCSVKEDYKNELAMVKSWFEKRNFVGVGETGIDLYWDKTFYEEQRIAFDFQIDLSKDLKVPIIIHSRDSLDITIEMIKAKQDGGLTGIFHCFSGTNEQAKQIVDLGFYLGIGGVLTYKNSDLPSTIADIDLDYMVLETDAPYLPPVPMRGKPNEPSFIWYVCDKLATTKSVSFEEVAKKTSANALKIFNIENSK